ncbi:putative phage abortive infection protein [Mesorhizobium sp. WSM1293]|uniref:putative phage abortive infection protein n=1 Tax=Mesorhizobium sp. WSM1293 TaxID=1040984 RepID=UPI0004AC7448|nr:putative phage abortive infection protein [Mesorhizobium sp. WSM1293]
MAGWVILWLAMVAFVALTWANTRGEQRWPGFHWFEGIIAPKIGDSAHGFYKILLASVIIVGGIFITGYAKFDKIQHLAEFGDFVGGVIGPVLTFLTFVGLLVTIILQQDANKEARAEATKAELAFERQLSSQKRESFESTFFQMLNLHNTIVNSMDIQRREDKDLKGRDCFRFFATTLKGKYVAYDNEHGTSRERAQRAYDRFWDERQQDLGHYFRYLFNVVKFIDNAQPNDHRYMKMLRAQLSDYELVILFYNSAAEIGKKFRPYIEKYAIFDNLPGRLLFDVDHHLFFNASAYGNPDDNVA